MCACVCNGVCYCAGYGAGAWSRKRLYRLPSNSPQPPLLWSVNAQSRALDHAHPFKFDRLLDVLGAVTHLQFAQIKFERAEDVRRGLGLCGVDARRRGVDARRGTSREVVSALTYLSSLKLAALIGLTILSEPC